MAALGMGDGVQTSSSSSEVTVLSDFPTFMISINFNYLLMIVSLNTVSWGLNYASRFLC